MLHKNYSIKINFIIAFSLGVIISLLSVNAYAENNILATVNGKPIDKRTLDFYVEQKKKLNPKYDASKNTELLIQELVNSELLYQDALRLKLDENKELKFRLQRLNHSLLSKFAFDKLISENAISDAQVRKEYEGFINSTHATEYKARHILVKDEVTAIKLINKLKKGANFEELARKESTGPSGEDGGDLGWFSAAEMVPEFSKAVAETKKGTYNKSAVKTQFGWHVIKLEDTRQMEAAKFDDVKEELRSLAQKTMTQHYMVDLREKAKIIIY